MHENTIDQVKSTMLKMGQPVPETITEAYRTQIRVLSLILEELSELAEAYGRPNEFGMMLILKGAKMLEQHPCDSGDTNLVKVMDAFNDLRVVCDGGVLAHGMAPYFNACMDEVKRSNDTKTMATEQHAIQEVKRYHEKGQTDVYYEQVDSHYVLYNKNGKYLKPSTYAPADIAGVLWPHLDEAQQKMVLEQSIS
jgi:hypothetical protein